MSDETQMNPELQKFAAQLGQADLPVAKLDRDQLMYDAGWAAALAKKSEPKKVAQKRNGFSSMALSFACGIASAAAVMLMLTPTLSQQGSPTVAETSTADVTLGQVAPIATKAPPEEVKDMLAWIEDIPQGHSISSGFTTRPTTHVSLEPEEEGSSSIDRAPNRAGATNCELMRELVPQRKVVPKAPLRSFLMFTGCLGN